MLLLSINVTHHFLLLPAIIAHRLSVIPITVTYSLLSSYVLIIYYNNLLKILILKDILKNHK